MNQTSSRVSSPLGILAIGLVLSAAAVSTAQPANDLCINAEALEIDVFALGSNEMATSDIAASSCAVGDSFDVWYSFTVPPGGAAEYRFEAIPDFTTTLPQPTLSAYDACGGPEMLCAEGDWRLDIDMVDGQTVYLRVAGAEQETGTFLMLASLAPLPPANDECDGAIPLNLDEQYFDFIEATPSGGGCHVDAADGWYRFTAPDADRYRFSVRGDLANVALYDGCSGAELACETDCYAIGRAELDLAAGQTVLVRAGGCEDHSAFLFSVTADRAPVAPANDHCTDAQPLTPGTTIPGTTRGATHLDEPEVHCFNPFPPTDLLGVWYSLTNPAAGSRLFHIMATPTGGDGFTPIVTVLSGCGGAGSLIACGGENGGPNQATSINAMLAAGETVLIRVAGDLFHDGDFDLFVSAPLTPAANDECASAVALTPGSSIAGSTANATESFIFFLGCANDDIIDAWYSITNTAASPRVFEIDTLGSTMSNPTLAAFDGCDGTLLDCALTEFSDEGAMARAAFIVGAGQTAFVRIAGTNRSVGDFVLNVHEPVPAPPPPANDHCDTATQVDFPFSEVVSAGAAVSDLPLGCVEGQVEASGGVWYSFTPSHEGMVRITQNGFSPSIAFGLFEGGCLAPTEVACSGFAPASFPVQAGVPYLLLISRAQADTASPFDVYDINIDLLEVPAWGDACADAGSINVPIRAFVNIGSAQNEGAADAPAGSCNGPDTAAAGMNNSVYFTFTAPESGDLQAAFAPLFFDAVAVLYEGTCGSLTEIACTAGNFDMGFGARVEAGAQYTLQLGAYEVFGFGEEIAFTLDIAPPSCRADLDGDGGVDVFDLLAYLDLWFAGDAAAELTGDDPAAINVFDLLVYLDAWFAGCR